MVYIFAEFVRSPNLFHEFYVNMDTYIYMYINVSIFKFLFVYLWIHIYFYIYIVEFTYFWKSGSPKSCKLWKKTMAITLSTKKSTECYFNGLGAKVCCLVPQRTWCPNYKSFEATRWLKAFFGEKQIVWGHSKTTKIIRYFIFPMELRNEEDFPNGTAARKRTKHFWLGTPWNCAETKARHANVAFALGAAVSRGPS